MKYSVIIEIPKGSDRRIHLSYDNSEFIDLGSIKDQIPINEGVMPVCYGYIENAINKDEKDNVDAIIFSSRFYKTSDIVEVEVIGMLTRKDGDHKVITVDDSVNIKNFSDIEPQERNLVLRYFGYKSEIISVGSKEKAIEYLESCMI